MSRNAHNGFNAVSGTVCDYAIVSERFLAVQISPGAGECGGIVGWLISLPPLDLETISRDLALISLCLIWEIAGDRGQIEDR